MYAGARIEMLRLGKVENTSIQLLMPRDDTAETSGQRAWP